MLRTLAAVIVLSATVGVTSAELVTISAQGTVEFNVIQGNQANVPDGAPVTMMFNVDSDTFLNSASFPTRGYNIIPSSFSLIVGGQPINIVDPQPNGPAYFVLRNNDPAVDGFFISRQGVDLPAPVIVTIPGLTPTHDLDFARSFTNGTPFPSLNILECLGTYGLENIGSFLWTVGRFGNPGAEYNYQSLTIARIPEPTSAGALMVAAALLRSRRPR